MPFIGLTGGFGTGKTTVLGIFKNLGAHTINADTLVHKILRRPLIIKKLSDALGSGILIKKNSRVSISKKIMAEAIFKNTGKRREAEKIIHPEVIKSANDIKRKILSRNHNAIIVFEVPLLFESGYRKTFDKVIVVYCSKAKAIERLAKPGFSREQALKRMHAQMPVSKKKALADFLINNNSDIDNTKKQVKEIFKKISLKLS